MDKFYIMINQGLFEFNYDNFIESMIELASHPRSGSDESFGRGTYDYNRFSNTEIAYSHWNWNRPLAYGIKFDSSNDS